MSSILSIDEVVRAVLRLTGHDLYFRQVSEAVIDLGTEQVEAILTTYQLGDVRAVCEVLNARIGDRFERGFFFPDAWVRIPPRSPRQSHFVNGRTFNRGSWYAVPKGELDALIAEPLYDGQPGGPPLFEHRLEPPENWGR